MTSKTLIPLEGIERRIYLIRGHKVMLDRDLADIYGVSTSRLNEQVKRNRSRFPEDFMFRLTALETANWRSQFAISNRGVTMGLRRPPYVFTEHGAVMLASVLNSQIAVSASIQVVRAFVKLREMIASHRDLVRRMDNLEKKYDAQFRGVFDAIRELMEPPKPVEEPETPKQPIGRSPTDLEAALPRVIARSDFYRTKNNGGIKNFEIWSGRRESNPRLILGKDPFYH